MALLQIRRGNTSNKGILAYGEPYYNCEIGAIQWGGCNGTEITIYGGIPRPLLERHYFTGSCSTTWSISHGLEDQYPQVTVYDLTNSTMIPGRVYGINQSTLEIHFSTPQCGLATIVGGLSISGSSPIQTLISTSYAETSSYALTASYALNGGGGAGFPFNGDAIISGSLVVTGSVTSVDGGFTGSLEGTSSFALTASYALNGGKSVAKFWIENTTQSLDADETIIISDNYILKNSLLILTGSSEEYIVGPISFKKISQLYIGGHLLLLDSNIVNDGIISVAGSIILSGSSTITGTGTII